MGCSGASRSPDMARLFQRSNSDKLRDLRASEADVRSGKLAERVTVVEDLLTEVDLVDLKDRVIEAEGTIEDHTSQLNDHETRISGLETP